ncbi:hypothetical protein Ajs_2445 [Acidovorax sp. JS42]|nr:hypothetical protein Ajs_2445 [Acidovorax sp. JS42]
MSSSSCDLVRVIFQQWSHLESKCFEVKSTNLKGSRTMNKTRNSLLAVVAVAAMSLLGANAAFASGYVHSANSEKGYVTQPEHFKSERSRAEIQAEAAEFAKKGGSDRFRPRWPVQIPPPVATPNSPGKTGWIMTTQCRWRCVRRPL